MRGRWIPRILKFFFCAVIAATVFSYVVMRLWNWLMPALFSLHAITFWQALGVLILSKILFGGFRPRGGRGRWRRRMMERWERMTPEEREKFRAGMSSRCGMSRPSTTETKSQA